MADDLRTRIAAVLLTHQHVNGKCLCQSLREQSTSGQHAKHVADAVIRELNLSTPVDYLSVDGTRRNFMLAGHYTVEVTR